MTGDAATSTVLVIDDAAEIRSLFRTAFHVDYPEVEVLEADTAGAALELVIDVHPDAVIVDGVMNGVDGVQLVGQLRDLCPSSRIVMFSSFPYGEIAGRARAGGADDFVEKSQGFQRVLAALGLR